MPTLGRMVLSWTGFPGGPGASVLYFDTPVTATQTALGVWIDAFKYLIPDNVTITIPSTGDNVDTATGQITGSWTAGAAVAKVGTGSSSSYFAAGGASIRWVTNAVVNGRRLTGRTYLVPLTALAYDNGTLVGTAVTAINTATATFVAAAGVDQHVYHRPTSVAAADGTSSLVTGHVLKDKQAILASRRD